MLRRTDKEGKRVLQCELLRLWKEHQAMQKWVTFQVSTDSRPDQKQSLKKIPVDERWWTADGAESAVGQKIQVPVWSPACPPFLNLISATARKANPFTSLSVSTHSKDVLFFLLRRPSSETQPKDPRSYHVGTALKSSLLPLGRVCCVCFPTPL